MDTGSEKLNFLMSGRPNHKGLFGGVLLLFLFGNLFWGCGSFNKISSPDWVHGESGKYPRSQYLTGVGVGETRERAEKEAYAALSRIFHAKIQSKSREWEEFLQSSTQNESNNNDYVHQKFIIDQLTQVSTEKVLENVFIAEVYENERKKRFFVLAVIDRMQSVSILQGKIRDLDHKAQIHLISIKSLEGFIDSIENSLQTVRALRGALRALLLREGFNADLQIIHPSGQGIMSPFSLEEVSRSLSDFLKNHLNIVLEVSGPFRNEIQLVFLRSLTREGFHVIQNDGGLKGNLPDDKGCLFLQAEFKLSPLTLQGKPFYRWDVKAVLLDIEKGQMIGTFDQQGREGHLQEKEAERRALRVAQKKILAEMGPEISRQIFGEENESYFFRQRENLK